MAQAAAARYAKALVDLATAPGAAADPRQVVEQLRAFESVLASSHELRHVLLSPAVAPARKRALVGRLGEPAGLSRLVRNFIYVVIDHRRIELLAEIREAFEALLDERTGVVRADVTSASPLSGAEQQAVSRQLSRLSGKQVRANFEVDPALVGGASARIGSTVYDGSVRGQLQALLRRMKAE